jgi:hypothetical protein
LWWVSATADRAAEADGCSHPSGTNISTNITSSGTNISSTGADSKTHTGTDKYSFSDTECDTDGHSEWRDCTPE